MSPTEIKNILDIATWVLVVFIILSAIIAGVYIKKQNENRALIQKRRWIESLPSLISTLGVLGTFSGITLGLWFFDTKNLNDSIPLLLSGLSTAFFTSLAGMIGSLILNRYVSSLYDEQDGGVSDINQAAALITKAMVEMKNDNVRKFNAIEDVLQKQLNVLQSQLTGQADIKDINAQQFTAFQAQASRIKSIDENLKSLMVSFGNMEDSLTAMKSTEQSVNDKFTSLTDTIGDIATATESTSQTQDSILEKFDTFGKFIGDEVDDIERKMGETNTLLTNKFDEFSELLKKSNTEALVGVMKNLTVEFQKQMGTLIERLVKENFDQLNQSVNRLNTWQQENKQQISTLIQQYKDMESDFESSSTTLKNVSADTQLLVSDGGKLQQLISALNQVVLDHQTYLDVAKKLQETADLTKDNMVKFDDSNSKLNEWVRKQRDFVESVQVLMAKLEEIGKIKDYGGEFWKETRSKMEKGGGIIKNGSTEIEKQLTSLDERFYQRLSATLAQLDACIQAMVKASGYANAPGGKTVINPFGI